jgi:hypothetical protein
MYTANVPRKPMNAEQFHASLVARYNRYVIRNADGCWGWALKPNRSFPYPALTSGHDERVSMHRFSYELHVGPIPEGMWVLHKCDNHRCTRPDHLYLGDHVKNQSDVRKRETSKKQRCRRGHIRTATNTYTRVDKRGYVERHCKICSNNYPNFGSAEAGAPPPGGRGGAGAGRG